MAVDWTKIYTDKYNEIAKGYEPQEKKYGELRDYELKQLAQQRDDALKSYDNTRNNSLREAYITRMNAQRDLPAMAAQQGIKGGASETAAASVLRSYQNARNAANDAYGNQRQSALSQYNQGAATIGSKYAEALANLQMQKREDAYKQAQFAYNAAKADEQAALEREKWEWEKQQAAAAAAAAAGGSGGYGRSYGSGGSGGSGTASGYDYRNPLGYANYTPGESFMNQTIRNYNQLSKQRQAQAQTATARTGYGNSGYDPVREVKKAAIRNKYRN